MSASAEAKALAITEAQSAGTSHAQANMQYSYKVSGSSYTAC